MLESVRLVNFKSHVDTTVELGRMTVLVGPNACGKTSVLDGLELLAALARVSALDAFGGQLERIHRTTRQGSKGINLSARGADGTSFEA
ncbi:MAG: AAA family ATPase, partial [Myxococcales bacterium]|nr:AAA family ATPase [Myxococcales bacterium]